MAAIEWSEALSIGVPLIDGQHKMWIDRLNAVGAACEANKGLVEIGQTLAFFSEYTDFHFGTEEKHMVAQNYPGLDAHRAKHEELKRTLGEMEQEFQEDGATHNLAEAVNNVLGTWFVEHIQGVDKQFGDYLQEKGVSLDAES